MDINKILKQIASELDCHYLRAEPSQANVDIENFELQEIPLVIYANYPVGEYTTINGMKAAYPLEIEILELSQEDDNTIESSIHISLMTSIAERFARKLMEYSPMIIDPDTFQITPLGMVKRYDDNLTGVLLEFNFEYIVTC